jgi:hypothetical protein
MTCLSLWLASGCISDHTVEADVPSPTGVVQPGGNGGTELPAAEACERMKSARAVVATKLGCDDPSDACPRYLFVAGSMPCALYLESSVDACVAVIDGYSSCEDFSVKACVATPVSASCVKPGAPEGGGGSRDSAGTPKEAGTRRDGATDAESADG